MKVMTCTNGNITLAYDTFGGTDGRPLLLIAPMGAASRLMYSADFCAALVDAGFHVARFDNRDAGSSTHLDKSAPKYDLGDMAADAVAVLDALGWPAAHIVGASLGGMIGQVMAVRQPTRVRTLTSIASAPCQTFRVSRPKLGTVFKVLGLNRRVPTDPDEYGEYLIALSRIIGSPTFPPEQELLRQIAHQVTPDSAADMRQLAAVGASGDRRAELARVVAPTLVLHGEADPLQSLRAARETVRAIPGARLVTYPDMGHDLPRPLWPAIIGEITKLADEANNTAVDSRH